MKAEATSKVEEKDVKTNIEDQDAVAVEEKGFSDPSSKPLVGASTLKKNSEKVNHDNDSISITSLDFLKSLSPVKGGSWLEGEEDATNAILVGKELSDYGAMKNCIGKNLGEEELIGRGLKGSQLSGDNVEFKGCLEEEGDHIGPKLGERVGLDEVG
ncbi:hypothetical protein V6N11_017583 [Hibiscus sabdariffa]|uniref:Uncharacterized protein n=1 Tax=Hibiscus sabdariffa TaxID=183260 RepID=A0ABR2TZ30_9ROSI